jgi:transglutaminase-like putative cysteine protease
MTVVDEVSSCRTMVGGFEYHSMMQAWLPTTRWYCLGDKLYFGNAT